MELRYRKQPTWRAATGADFRLAADRLVDPDQAIDHAWVKMTVG